MVHERKTPGRPTENPKHEELKTRDRRKGTPEPEKRREQCQKNTEGHQATGGLPKTTKWNTKVREVATEDAASDNNK